jgi:hypothetical protein
LLIDSGGDGSLLLVEQLQGKVTHLSSPGICSRGGEHWQLLSGHLLHFETIQPDENSDRAHRIELFDLKGQLLATLQVPPPSGVLASGIDWVGPVAGHGLVFSRWQRWADDKAPSITADDLLLVDLPALKVRRTIDAGMRPLVEGWRSKRTFHTAPGCLYVFALTGGVLVGTMKPNSIPHELTVEAFDLATGKVA